METEPVRSSAPQPAHRDRVRVIDVKTLLGDREQVVLVHCGVEYRLRVTRQGKLLLTK